jgi:hypothetical protein
MSFSHFRKSRSICDEQRAEVPVVNVEVVMVDVDRFVAVELELDVDLRAAEHGLGYEPFVIVICPVASRTFYATSGSFVTSEGAGLPSRTESMLSRASMPIAKRVSTVALPTCGNRNVFLSATYPG